jgi:hypothetical protein
MSIKTFHKIEYIKNDVKKKIFVVNTLNTCNFFENLGIEIGKEARKRMKNFYWNNNNNTESLLRTFYSQDASKENTRRTFKLFSLFVQLIASCQQNRYNEEEEL